MLMGEVRAERLMQGIDEAIRETLTPAQEEAIRRAAERNPWDKHAVDIRLTLPMFLDDYYVTLVAGRERRSPARLAAERGKHPLLRSSNIVFFAGATVAAGLLALCFLTLIGVLAL